MKIYADLKSCLGDFEVFNYISHEPLYEYQDNKRTDNIIGTSVTILDKEANKVKVKLPIKAADFPNDIKQFEPISFNGLEGLVYGVSRMNSTYVDLKVSYRADGFSRGS